MTLFDTDVVIWMTRGNRAASAAINAAPARALSAVSYMEYLRGARDAREVHAFKRYLNVLQFRILPVTEAISEKAIAIMESHALATRLDPDDALIFATALDLDIELCSGNDKHFRGIEGLRCRVFRPG